MSRYLRTKDGRVIDKERVVKGFELVHIENIQLECCPCNGWYWKDQDGDYELEVGDDEIEREADTIEELCDYVIRKPFGSVDDIPFVLRRIIHKGYLDRNNYEEVREVLRQQHRGQENGDKATIYLATPTRRGITYVAKMNEKGELELL